ncbi:undecaprenyl/decaprenyl-phosphate alpha-N-acetylglucosaminyl 1-phosphate transferase [Rhodanobacter sp. C06]|uniref:undecaprenyl/decaprenyl-phosphate alpha-N-acetylglucosaminyl 1-phosphate transferase n=1 Tax=Rhodanobacter sp. C06 TaxID=1945854 RepID=UPI0020C4C8C8|nr:undecaprenyl/decaprenyl-phosphate alpha-N-acetylglucosaminyl 1-phosphate transferase [Rhodanobacter sp. C06]
MQELRLLLGVMVAACTSAAGIVAMRRFALALGLVDRPDQRKQHLGEVPLVGGLAIFTGMLAGAVCYGVFDGFERSLLGTAAVLALLGALDDRFGLSVRDRLLIQTIAILTVIASTGVYIHTLGHIFGHDVVLGWLGVPMTVLAVIGLVNAFNMMDGIDGLAGSLTLVSIAAVILFASPTPLRGVIMLLALLAAATLPYLVVNLGFVGGKVFLGDAGSTLIGYLLAWVLIRLSQMPETHLSPVDVLWCVALPVLDTLAVMYRRMRAGQSPFKPDRGHIHHILQGAGLGPRATLAALVVLAVGLASIGAIVSGVAHSAGVNLAVFCLILGVYMTTVMRLWLRQEAHRQSGLDPQRGIGAKAISTGAGRSAVPADLVAQGGEGRGRAAGHKTGAYRAAEQPDHR